MNREFYQAKAYADGVKAARAIRRPLEVWPSERHLVKLADLPIVGVTEQREGPGEPEAVFLVKSDAELQTFVEVGRKYAKLALTADGDGWYTIGRW
jgi:hypothetical protein